MNQQNDSITKSLILDALPLGESRRIDGLKLVQQAGQPFLLYSMQVKEGHEYAMEIRSISVSGATPPSKVAVFPRLLPAPPEWDAQLDQLGRFEFVVQEAGGAVNSLTYQQADGSPQSITTAYRFESFSRPHFARVAPGVTAAEIGAVVDERRVVALTLPQGGTPAPYVPLSDGADGIIGGADDRWVISKALRGGPSRFDVIPGTLTLTKAAHSDHREAKVSLDGLVFEFDATSVAGDVAIVTTGEPAKLLLSSRSDQAYPLETSDASLLTALSRPTLSIGGGRLHVAVLANPRSDVACVLYGSIPLSDLTR